MVAELDFTDQDVTDIAAMIDSEIQIYIPEWLPGGDFEENRKGNVAVDNTDTVTQAELSALQSGSDNASGNLVLDRLSSGRMYWSDLPKDFSGEFSPKLSLADMPSELDPNASVDDFDDVCRQVHHSVNCRSGGDTYSNGISSCNDPHELDSTSHSGEINTVIHSDLPNAFTGDADDHKDEDVSLCNNMQLGNSQNEPTVEFQPADGTCALQSYKMLLEDGQEDERNIIERLNNILCKQHKELDELKAEHGLEITEFLKGVPHHLRQKNLGTQLINVMDYKMSNQVQWPQVHMADHDIYLPSEALQCHVKKLKEDAPIDDNLVQNKMDVNPIGSSSFSLPVDNTEKQEPVFGNHVGSFVFRDRSSTLRADPRSSDMGIAVILRDNMIKSTSAGNFTHLSNKE
ncbi:hypothetical protein QJS04_geneDACA004297 [Acorus gramineus]|uniref:Uncharacterized protein n=1 Tax=Acorus gramineus TaxID=55184 RepID=A0AAV9B420_ACOGR|nr:hypothetical protein QJS04_geneDACA004297 [Acorus gramineus]